MRKLLIVLGALLAPVMIAVTFADNTPLMVDGNDQLGKFLTDSKGMTFYLFKKDTPGVRNRYDAARRPARRSSTRARRRSPLTRRARSQARLERHAVESARGQRRVRARALVAPVLVDERTNLRVRLSLCLELHHVPRVAGADASDEAHRLEQD